MKYFFDTEFIEGTQCTLFGESKPTIDLISIGIVAEDGREYYAISKDFNLKEAWNRYQLNERKDYENYSLKDRGKILYDKEYWIRENILKPIFDELVYEDEKCRYRPLSAFTYGNFKKLINKYGKTNKQIAEEVIEFCKGKTNERNDGFREYVYNKNDINKENPYPANGYFENRTNPEFYGYYSDYDWVVFCWLFGRMIDLPNGFPMYCNDLKQTLDRHCIILKETPKTIKELNGYPKQTNEHNALADAKWNYELYKFLNNQF